MKENGWLIARVGEEKKNRGAAGEVEELRKILSKQEGENMFHLENVEKLRQHLEIYKSKSSREIEKKIGALETDARKEAKNLKIEKDRLEEIISFKNGQMEELQKEIKKLKTIIKAEAENEKFPGGTSTSSLMRSPKKTSATDR